MSRLTRRNGCLDVSNASDQIKCVVRPLLLNFFSSLTFCSARFLYVFELLFGKRINGILFFLPSTFCSWEFCSVTSLCSLMCNYISGIKMSNLMHFDVTLGLQIHCYHTESELTYNSCHFVNVMVRLQWKTKHHAGPHSLSPILLSRGRGRELEK